MKLHFILIFVLALSVNFTFAQSEKNSTGIHYVDVIKLRGGVEFRGKIIKYLHNQFVTLQTPDGQVHNFNAKDVKKITQERIDQFGESHRESRPYAFQEEGRYFAFYAGLIGGTAAGPGVTDRVMGNEISLVIGHQFNRWIGMGLGVGASYFYPGAGEGVYPLFVEARGYLNQLKIAPYYSVSAGYGFAFKNEDRNIMSAEGGPMFHPAIGFRFGAAPKINFVMDIGVKFQNATYMRDTRGWGWGGWIPEEPNFTTHHMYYKRLEIRAGMVF